MNLNRRELLSLGGLMLTGSLFAPHLSLGQAPRRGGTLTIRAWDPPFFDQMLTTAYRVHVPISFTDSRLLRHRAGPRVGPTTFPIEGDLAESWTQPNETTYVFKLRKGVRWHPKPPVNGRELTAKDVLYTVDRFLTVKGNPTAYMLKSVDRVEALDPYTLKQYYVQIPSAIYIAVWDGALKNYGPNLGYDYGGRLMAAWLDR